MKQLWGRLLLWAVSLAVVIGLPLGARWARHDEVARCAQDGLPIDLIYQVRIVDDAGVHRFCSVGCAARWLAKTKNRPTKVVVTDEVSGAELDAAKAIFVQSSVRTNPITRNSTHVFRDRAAAAEHMRTFGGSLLTGVDRPFPGAADGPVATVENSN